MFSRFRLEISNKFGIKNFFTFSKQNKKIHKKLLPKRQISKKNFFVHSDFLSLLILVAKVFLTHLPPFNVRESMAFYFDKSPNQNSFLTKIRLITIQSGELFVISSLVAWVFSNFSLSEILTFFFMHKIKRPFWPNPLFFSRSLH